MEPRLAAGNKMLKFIDTREEISCRAPQIRAELK
jgi:hypothetical protein